MPDTENPDIEPDIEKDVNADYQLKVCSSVYSSLEGGAKNFEVRLNDRCYSEASILHLCEWDRFARCFTGRSCLRRITYILYGGNFGLYGGNSGVEDGYVVLALAPLLDDPRPMREALTEAHDWLDNGKCLWGGEDEFAALMDKIGTALGERANRE